MVYVDLASIIPVVIGAIVAFIGSILYYRYTTYKENKTKFLERQITELLLPLYFHFMDIEVDYNILKELSQHLNTIKTDTEIRKIGTNKFYLASPKLRNLLIEFLKCQAKYQFENEFIKDHLTSLPDNFYKNYEELRNTVYKECKEKIELYQKNYQLSFWASLFSW